MNGSSADSIPRHIASISNNPNNTSKATNSNSNAGSVSALFPAVNTNTSGPITRPTTSYTRSNSGSTTNPSAAMQRSNSSSGAAAGGLVGRRGGSIPPDSNMIGGGHSGGGGGGGGGGVHKRPSSLLSTMLSRCGGVLFGGGGGRRRGRFLLAIYSIGLLMLFLMGTIFWLKRHDAAVVSGMGGGSTNGQTAAVQFKQHDRNARRMSVAIHTAADGDNAAADTSSRALSQQRRQQRSDTCSIYGEELSAFFRDASKTDDHRGGERLPIIKAIASKEEKEGRSGNGKRRMPSSLRWVDPNVYDGEREDDDNDDKVVGGIVQTAATINHVANHRLGGGGRYFDQVPEPEVDPTTQRGSSTTPTTSASSSSNIALNSNDAYKRQRFAPPVAHQTKLNIFSADTFWEDNKAKKAAASSQRKKKEPPIAYALSYGPDALVRRRRERFLTPDISPDDNGGNSFFEEVVAGSIPKGGEGRVHAIVWGDSKPRPAGRDQQGLNPFEWPRRPVRTRVHTYSEEELLAMHHAMDIVVSYVNGSDSIHRFHKLVKDYILPGLREKRAGGWFPTQQDRGRSWPLNNVSNLELFLSDTEGPSSLTGTMDREHDELRYNFRSLHANLRWHCGRLIILSDANIPSWLNRARNFFMTSLPQYPGGPSHPLYGKRCLNADTRRVTVVHQDAVVPMAVRSTFNTNTIELYIFRIRRLSNLYIHYNDDYLTRKPTTVSTFVNKKGGAVLRFEEGPASRMRYNADDKRNGWYGGVIHTNGFVEEALGDNLLNEDPTPADTRRRVLQHGGEPPRAMGAHRRLMRTSGGRGEADHSFAFSDMRNSPFWPRPRYFLKHAPFVMCRNMFRRYLMYYHSSRISGAGIESKHRSSKDFVPPQLHNAFLTDVPWAASPKFTPDHMTPGMRRAMDGALLAQWEREKLMCGFAAANSAAEDVTTIDLDNSDGCAPALLQIGSYADSHVITWSDDEAKNARMLQHVMDTDPIFLTLNDNGYTKREVEEQVAGLLGASFPYPSVAEDPRQAVTDRLASMRFIKSLHGVNGRQGGGGRRGRKGGSHVKETKGASAAGESSRLSSSDGKAAMRVGNGDNDDDMAPPEDVQMLLPGMMGEQESTTRPHLVADGVGVGGEALGGVALTPVFTNPHYRPQQQQLATPHGKVFTNPAYRPPLVVGQNGEDRNEPKHKEEDIDELLRLRRVEVESEAAQKQRDQRAAAAKDRVAQRERRAREEAEAEARRLRAEGERPIGEGTADEDDGDSDDHDPDPAVSHRRKLLSPPEEDSGLDSGSTTPFPFTLRRIEDDSYFFAVAHEAREDIFRTDPADDHHPTMRESDAAHGSVNMAAEGNADGNNKNVPPPQVLSSGGRAYLEPKPLYTITPAMQLYYERRYKQFNQLPLLFVIDSALPRAMQCALLRSLQLALPDHEGMVGIVLDGTRGFVTDQTTYPERCFILCRHFSKNVRMIKPTERLSEVLSSMRLDVQYEEALLKKKVPAEVKANDRKSGQSSPSASIPSNASSFFPRHSPFLASIDGMVIRVGCVTALGQTLALEDFTVRRVGSARVLFLEAPCPVREEEMTEDDLDPTSVNWVLAPTVWALLQSYPIPYRKYEPSEILLYTF